MDSALLNTLHPFSFITNAEGRILSVGRSLLRLFPSVVTNNSVFSIFKVERPFGISDSPSVAELMGDLLVLSRKDDPSFRLRGEVVETSTVPPCFVFALTPAITKVEQIRSMNLLLNDFPLGEPILDFLLFMQQQRASQELIEAGRRELEWENRTSTLLYKIVLATQEANEPCDVYREVLTTVCEGLRWEIGHLFVRDQDDPSQLVSFDEWYIQPGLDITNFREASAKGVCKPEIGLIGRCLHAQEAQWVQNLSACQFYLRPNPLPNAENVTAVAIPVIEDHVVTAVFEFYTSRVIQNADPFRRLFGLVGIQISNILSRIRAKRKEAEQLAALVHASKMASLGEIVAGVAHEINNPLYTLSLIAQILRRLNDRAPLSQAELATQVSRIESSVDRMAKIVHELRDFSRDSGKDPMRATQLNQIINDTTDLCSSRFQNSSVELIIEPVPPHWTVECRASQISQVILNALNNAYDACKKLENRWIKLQCADIGNAYAIRITDSGPGIPSSISKKIMDPFFTTKPPGEGTGLGLSISSNIMIDHHGSLRLDRESAHTSFLITIPKKQPTPLLQQAV